uniref:Major facilitator superfamily protein n=1 Tax=Spironucleus salmonicida TaxID=348837 RepID=V6LRU5_9EUKA|eukprot:EST43504.1 Major facilitator superfamily protein [Spironucleus salmonicida]
MEPTVPPPSWPAWRILAATLPLFGISFCFELYAVLNQPYLAELHLSPQASALCQGLGQACAFVTQPLAGYCMDRSPSRHGPRRVCLAVGAALTAVSQLWCGFASRVAGAFFAPGSAPHATFVLAWAVLGVALFNIAVNVEFVALRALVLANLPEHLQAAGAAAQVLMLGLANAACGLIMLGLDLHAQTGRWAELYPVVAPIACMATVLSAHPALVFVEDPPTAAPEPPRNAASHLWSELRAMERRLWWAMLALFLGWLAFTPSQQFAGTVHSIPGHHRGHAGDERCNRPVRPAHPGAPPQGRRELDAGRLRRDRLARAGPAAGRRVRPGAALPDSGGALPGAARPSERRPELRAPGRDRHAGAARLPRALRGVLQLRGRGGPGGGRGPHRRPPRLVRPPGVGLRGLRVRAAAGPGRAPGGAEE